jgi:hypothetical protein
MTNLYDFRPLSHQAPSGTVHADALASSLAVQIDAHPGAVQLKYPDGHLGPKRTHRGAKYWFHRTIASEGKPGDHFEITWPASPSVGCYVNVVIEPRPVALGLAWLEAHFGTPYVFGDTDCSWASLKFALAATGGKLELAHYSGAQFNDTRLVRVPDRAHAQVGDLLFYGTQGSQHVAVLADLAGEGWVYDEEPGSEVSPNGGTIHGGLYRRPMQPGYYVAWSDGPGGGVTGIRRVPL